MDRVAIINTIGIKYHTPNIEGGEYSYIQEAGSKEKLTKALGRTFKHFKLDIRFEDSDVVILVETKQLFTDDDENQLREYLDEERALHSNKKIICILANTQNDKIKVWKSTMDAAHLLKNETTIDTMEHYKSLFSLNRQNNREKVLKNTYDLNELLHKKDIDERLRSQFVGTTILYIKDVVQMKGITHIDDESIKLLKEYWENFNASQIRRGIQDTLEALLDGSRNKTLKIELLQRNVLNNQRVKQLTKQDWIEILTTIVRNIYAYIDLTSSEGQDILNLFFIAFNKYTGKADKNQAFTPDHITDFMCRITGVDKTKRVLDATCGSGSFLVQAMVKELADCASMVGTAEQKEHWMETVKREHIYGIEVEEKAYGLATTNMLIHGDGNSNIEFGSIFDKKQFIKDADPDIILMNPPYNAKPIGIPAIYKKQWGKSADGKEDPTKGFVFIQFIADCLKELNQERISNGGTAKEVKLAVLLPVATAIGTSNIITAVKKSMLIDNTLEAVFTLPNEIFYPGASASACCMLFTLGKPHRNPDGTVNKTFFGYYKDDGHKKKKNLGRVEQFDKNDKSIWKSIEEEWLSMYRNKEVKAGMSAMAVVSGTDEWLCEAYMKTDYSKLCEADFQKTLNNYLAYQIKEGKIFERQNGGENYDA